MARTSFNVLCCAFVCVCVCAFASMTTEFSNEKDDGVVVVVVAQVRRIKKITDYHHFECFFVRKGLSPLEH